MPVNRAKRQALGCVPSDLDPSDAAVVIDWLRAEKRRARGRKQIAKGVVEHRPEGDVLVLPPARRHRGGRI